VVSLYSNAIVVIGDGGCVLVVFVVVVVVAVVVAVVAVVVVVLFFVVMVVFLVFCQLFCICDFHHLACIQLILVLLLINF